MLDNYWKDQYNLNHVATHAKEALGYKRQTSPCAYNALFKQQKFNEYCGKTLQLEIQPYTAVAEEANNHWSGRSKTEWGGGGGGGGANHQQKLAISNSVPHGRDS